MFGKSGSRNRMMTSIPICEAVEFPSLLTDRWNGEHFMAVDCTEYERNKENHGQGYRLITIVLSVAVRQKLIKKRSQESLAPSHVKPILTFTWLFYVTVAAKCPSSNHKIKTTVFQLNYCFLNVPRVHFQHRGWIDRFMKVLALLSCDSCLVCESFHVYRTANLVVCTWWPFHELQ